MWLHDPFQILLEEDNVVIPSATMFCHWVLDIDAVHLPLNCFPRGLVLSSNDWPPNDRSYLPHDGFDIVLIFLSLDIRKVSPLFASGLDSLS